jgi:hypothetical protein
VSRVGRVRTRGATVTLHLGWFLSHKDDPRSDERRAGEGGALWPLVLAGSPRGYW